MADGVKAYILDLEGVTREFRSYNLPSERKAVMGNQGLVNPPIDLVTLARFYDESTYHRNAVSVKARSVPGSSPRTRANLEIKSNTTCQPVGTPAPTDTPEPTNTA